MSEELRLDLTKCRSYEDIFKELEDAGKLHDDVIDIVGWMDGGIMSGFLWGLNYALGLTDTKASDEYKRRIEKRIEDMKSYNEDVA